MFGESSVDGPYFPNSLSMDARSEADQMAESSGDVRRERLIASWRLKVIMYKPSLTSVRPMMIMRKMKLLGVDHPVLEKVFELDMKDRIAEASETFLNYLLDETDMQPEDVADRWKSFDNALKEAHDWLYDIVSGKEDPSKHELQKNLIRYFMDEICIRVNPAHILPHLRPLLGDIEYERLESTLRNDGPTLAATYMVGHLPLSTDRNWFRKFQKALIENDYGDLAELLDDKGYESLIQELYGDMDYESDPSTDQPIRTSEGGGGEGSMEVETWSRKPSSPAGSKHPHDPEEKELKRPRMASSTTLSPLMTELDLEETSLKGCLDDAPSLSSMSSEEAATSYARKLGDVSDNQDRPHTGKQFHAKDIDSFQGDNSNAEVGRPSLPEEDGGEEEVVEISLRTYQEELARRPLLGQNTIICAPTGSGKTQVSLKIMQVHLQQNDQGVRKAVFLVNQVALAEQQYEQCRRHLRGFRVKCVTGNTGETEKVPLKHLLVGCDVLVMTAQILLDALDRQEIDSICQFSLIIFDECHHTNQRHPFNCIMHHYMAVKYSNRDDQHVRLPQVVGLTASVGVGKANTEVAALNHIKKLCAHLDASYICTVKHEVEQLARFTNEPTYDQHICSKRDPDLFMQKVEEIMKEIEENMQRSQHKEKCPEIADKLNPPRQRGTSQYTGWASQLRKEIAKLIRDSEAKRFYESARRMLEFYNTSLVINDECDTEDAFEYLKKQFAITYDSIGKSQQPVDVWLQELFDKNTKYMEHVSVQQANTNPKLIKLEDLLIKAFNDVPESRAMVFVKTRDLASALLHWMRRRPDLKELRPGKMVGAGASVESGGMTKNQQVDVMQYFRDGDHKVMIATSVAEEGLDIRKCNLVIRYNHVTNEIAMVQARGRARAENSQFVTLAGDDRGVQAKEEVNFIRELMMRDAIKQLQLEMDAKPTELRRILEQIQREEKSLRDIELQQRKGRQMREGEVEFRCRKCDDFAFMSSDLRKIENMHHVVIDLEFRNRHNERPTPRPETFVNITMMGRLTCKTCGDEWGKSILYKQTKFPVISVGGFVLTDEFDRKDAPKKWKQVTFHIGALSSDELETYRREAASVGYIDD